MSLPKYQMRYNKNRIIVQNGESLDTTVLILSIITADFSMFLEAFGPAKPQDTHLQNA